MTADYMSQFDAHDKGLSVLEESSIIMHSDHLIVIIPSKYWTDLLQSTFLCSNLSMQFELPVNIVTKDGSKSAWWTRGINYNPYGPSLEFHEGGLTSVKYTNEQGYPHRIDGPATVERSPSGYYKEEWMIHPGVLHREGGPAKIESESTPNHHMLWSDVVQRNRGLYSKRFFPSDTPVQAYQTRRMMWMKNGRFADRQGSYNDIIEEGVYVVSRITPTLGTRIYTFTNKRSYIWRDEDGYKDRTDGPAVVTLNHVKQLDEGGKKASLQWGGNHHHEWYTKGTGIERFELEKWMNRHKIEKRSGPAVENGVFVKPDDEFCFMTDFLPRVDRNEVLF